jgi:hypothetical protein
MTDAAKLGTVTVEFEPLIAAANEAIEALLSSLSEYSGRFALPKASSIEFKIDTR